MQKIIASKTKQKNTQKQTNKNHNKWRNSPISPQILLSVPGCSRMRMFLPRLFLGNAFRKFLPVCGVVRKSFQGFTLWSKAEGSVLFLLFPHSFKSQTPQCCGLESASHEAPCDTPKRLPAKVPVSESGPRLPQASDEEHKW